MWVVTLSPPLLCVGFFLLLWTQKPRFGAVRVRTYSGHQKGVCYARIHRKKAGKLGALFAFRFVLLGCSAVIDDVCIGHIENRSVQVEVSSVTTKARQKTIKQDFLLRVEEKVGK